MSENSYRDLKMERFRLVRRNRGEGGSNYHFHLISNLFAAKFFRTF